MFFDILQVSVSYYYKQFILVSFIVAALRL